MPRYGPDVTLESEVSLPVSQPATCAFGGPNCDKLFVSSAREGLVDAA